MTKPKYPDLVVVPIRADVPVGKKFKFAGGKAVYEVAKPPEPSLACALCSLRKPKKRLLCASFSCAPTFRADESFVYAKRVK